MKLNKNLQTTKKNEDLIASLSDDLCCVKVICHPFWRFVPWFIGAVVYLSVAIGVLGARPDLMDKMNDAYYLFELILVFSLSASAASCTLWLCIPDMREQKWMLGIPLCLFSVFLVLTILRILLEGNGLPDVHYWHQCHKNALIFGVVPAVSIILLSVKGKTVSPFLLSFMNVLSVGGLGYIGLRIVCHADDVGHLCIYHIAPYLLLGFIGAIICRRIYRW